MEVCTLPEDQVGCIHVPFSNLHRTSAPSFFLAGCLIRTTWQAPVVAQLSLLQAIKSASFSLIRGTREIFLLEISLCLDSTCGYFLASRANLTHTGLFLSLIIQAPAHRF